MKIFLFATEDKINFTLDQNNEINCHGFKFNHGIISEGLLKRFLEEKLDLKLWDNYVSYLNGDLNELDNELLLKIQDLSLSAGTLHFNHSTICAMESVSKYIIDNYHSHEIITEIISLQEGHISSVWKVNITDSNNKLLESFILNIARDYAAGVRLRSISELMKEMRENYSDVSVAGVYSIDTVEIEYFGELIEVVVTRNEYINGAKNIFIMDKDEFEKPQYYIAEKFLDSSPGATKKVLARPATDTIIDEINRTIDCVTDYSLNGVFAPPNLPVYNPDGSYAPKLDINRGDLVWDGEKVIVVWLS